MKRWTLFTLAAVLAAGTAQAQTIAPPQSSLTTTHLSVLDTNRDGMVTKAEMEDFATRSFRALDRDSNGSLSASELGSTVTSDQFLKMDTNRDGKISWSEYQAEVRADFAAADRNGDGILR